LEQRHDPVSFVKAARGIPLDVRAGIETVPWNLIRIIPA